MRQKFGYLKVVEAAGTSKRGKALWRCVCERQNCGKDCFAEGVLLRNGDIVSCGCYKASIGKANRTHGMTKTATYACWNSMIRRCQNPTSNGYELYGGRGIQVCDRWRSFENFYADMGEVPEGHSIERKDVNGHYEPSNCVWILIPDQGKNRRNTLTVTWNGETKRLIEWAEELSLPYPTLHWRLKHGWDANRIFTTPVK